MIKQIITRLYKIAYELGISNTLIDSVKMTKYLYDGKKITDSYNLKLDVELEESNLTKSYHIDKNDENLVAKAIFKKERAYNFFSDISKNIDVLFTATV